MNIKIIDMHCHLLPGIDDGSKDMFDTITALHMANEQGVRKIIMTPHFNPDNLITPERVVELTAQVQQAIKNENLDIDIYTGMECMYFSELPALLEKGEALPLAGSRYVLVEFPADATHLQIEKGLENIFEAGCVPILAHYERYPSLTAKGRLDNLRAKGCLLQLNYDTIQRRYGLLRRNPFYKDIKNGKVDFLGSDCHGSVFRKYFIEPSVNWLKVNLSQEDVFSLTYANPSRIINNVYQR